MTDSDGAAPETLFASASVGSGFPKSHLAREPSPTAPLAVRMRPRTLDELIGQQHLLTPGSPLRRLVEGDAGMSVVLYGPPGTGKTTLASVVSRSTGRRFVEISAVSAGVKELRAAIDEAKRVLVTSGEETVLFVDEVHRFSKTQQDALLPGVENRWVTLIAATTENPFFALVSPLLSRSLLMTLAPLTEPEIRQVLQSALADERGFGGRLVLTPDAEDHLVRLSGGDARRGLTYLEAAAAAASAATETADSAATGSPRIITLAAAEQAVDRAAVRYDRDGDQHYDITSALIKSIRGSDADAALHYLARMAEAGEDPRFLARRLVILASEDIGLADPTALQTAVAGAQAVQLLGWPEARITLAQVVLALALAPKSNAVIIAIDAALADVKAGLSGPVPPALRDAHYAGAKKLAHGAGYNYAHDDPRGVTEQQFAPDSVQNRQYYRPTRRGAESDYGQRYTRLKAIVRGTPAPDTTAAQPGSGDANAEPG